MKDQNRSDKKGRVRKPNEHRNFAWQPAEALRGCRTEWDGPEFPVTTTKISEEESVSKPQKRKHNPKKDRRQRPVRSGPDPERQSLPGPKFSQRRLCAHADLDGQDMHFLEPGEICPRLDAAKRDLAVAAGEAVSALDAMTEILGGKDRT